MDVGIIILCPDRNPAGLRNSVGSVRYHCYDRECLAVVPGDTSPVTIRELKEHCPLIHKGQDTITSLVNAGMKKLKHEWGFIMFGGSRVVPYLERRLATFVKSNKDILYPIVDMKCDFVEGCFNGVLINRDFFMEVGDFPAQAMQKEGLNDFEFAKLLWATDAVVLGAKFKGIVGMRII